MKKLFLVLLFVAISTPFLANAHTGNGIHAQERGFIMMQQIEDQALGDELHEEMESLMTKLMAGNLTESEINRVVELMDENPGPGSMMMGRMMGMGTFGSGINSFNKNSMTGYEMSGFGGGIFMILFWVLVVVGIIVLVRYTVNNTIKSESSNNGLDILKERYAKGEIDKDEFEVKKKDLQ
tara:strand:+ start:691 stop:1233 length:543 start_codon:yes stop_codon:yes gene_type:complete